MYGLGIGFREIISKGLAQGFEVEVGLGFEVEGLSLTGLGNRRPWFGNSAPSFPRKKARFWFLCLGIPFPVLGCGFWVIKVDQPWVLGSGSF